jgi:YegS/Rv2252/BmrU family lipid kinase
VNGRFQLKCNVIINPSSGKGKSVKVWEEVAPIFQDSGWSTTVHFTDYSDISKYLDHCEGIIAVGGDGTFHSIANNLMQSQRKIPLGFIPAGTGNSLMMDLDCPNPRDAARRIVEGKRHFIDVLEVTTAKEIIYSINIVGWGMFSQINQTAEKLRWFGGWRYNLATLWNIIFKQTYPATVKFGNDTEEGEFIAIFASNTKHTGKGMRAVPKAKIDDGLIDLVMIKNANRLSFLKFFRDYLKGQHLAHKLVTYRQLTSFELQTNVHQILNIDGELKGSSPFSVRILPKAIELLL